MRFCWLKKHYVYRFKFYGKIDLVMMAGELIKEQLECLPDKPGVYLMKDAAGKIIYVGKAANLRNRVRSYFGSKAGLAPKVLQMVSKVYELDFFITTSEQEALMLELNLIKQYRPFFNVRLKDDKTFPYLRIDVDSDWPQITVTRRWEKDGARYFGPFSSAWAMRQTLKMIRNIFPTRSCSRPIDGKQPTPCLEYHIKNCPAPCIGAITREEYQNTIKQVILFLEGKQEKIVQELKEKMQAEAEALHFEKAALLRDQIQAIENVIEAQSIATRVNGELDALAFVSERDQAYVQVFIIRNSRLIGRESFILQGTKAEEPQEIMTSFLKQFYDSSPYIPKLILVQYPVKEKEFLEQWLTERKGEKVEIRVPVRGSRKQLIDMVAENAQQWMEQHRIRQMSLPGLVKKGLEEIQKELGLDSPPERIEGFDISNIQGSGAVGSMVVFKSGKPDSGAYRRFKIKTVSQPDDYAMLQEVVRRRFKRAGQKIEGENWSVLPDLILVDGGKGQINAVKEIMKEMNLGNIPLIGLAKDNEEIYIPGRSGPLVLPGNSPGLQLLQRVRDEAHRFALGYFQKVHRRSVFTSVLDGINGIGEKRKKALLQHFGSVNAIKNASLEEIANVKGMNRGLAERIKNIL